MKYIGRRVCSCNIADDLYLGSGVFFKEALQLYGAHNFEKEILCVCNNDEELLKKEEEYIEMFDAVNSMEYYNIAPGGARRPDGFKRSDEENDKIERLKDMMNNEIIYGVKVENDKKRTDEGKIQRIFFLRTIDSENYYLYLVSDDTKPKKRPAEDINNKKVPHTIEDRETFIDWMHDSDYMLISKEDYIKYKFAAGEGSDCFKQVSKEISIKNKKYFEDLRRSRQAAKKIIKKPKEDYQIDVDIENKRNVNFFDKLKEHTSEIKSMEIVNNTFTPKTYLTAKCIEKLALESADYRNFITLLNEYPDLGLAEIYHAVTGSGSITNNKINDGKLKCDIVCMNKAREILNYEMRFLPLCKKIKGYRHYFMMALAFCYNCDKIDNEYLYEKVIRKRGFTPMKSINVALSQIQTAYNRNIEKDNKEKVLFKHEYEIRKTM